MCMPPPAVPSENAEITNITKVTAHVVHCTVSLSMVMLHIFCANALNQVYPYTVLVSL